MAPMTATTTDIAERVENSSMAALASGGTRSEFEDTALKEPIRRFLRDTPELATQWPQGFKRLCRTCLFVAPLLEAAAGRPLKDLTLLEIGSGSGSRTLALSPLVKRIVACDLNTTVMNAGRKRAADAGLTNVEWIEAAGEEVLASDIGRSCDAITLYAVLEHTRLSERAEILRALHEDTRDGQVIYVGETPNRLAGFDHHSSQLPFFQSLPDELALAYLARSERREYADDIVAAADPVERLYRRGRGPSFHEFDLYCGGLESFDNWVAIGPEHNTLLNLYAYDHDSPLLRRRLEVQGIPQADLFSRHYLEFALRRTGPRSPSAHVLQAEHMGCVELGRDQRKLPIAVARGKDAIRMTVPAGDSLSLGIPLGPVEVGGERLRSRGRFLVETSAGATHTFALGDLRKWRPSFALYHNYAFVQIPLSGGTGAEELTIRPKAPQNMVGVSSAFVRSAR